MMHFSMSKLLAALAVFGLLLAPFAPLTLPTSVVGTADVAQHASMEMPADMPCCPDQAPAKDCAQDCPFMLMCAGQNVQNRVGGSGPPIPLVASSLILPGNDAEVASLSHRPPPRPPKLLA
jgi:hypothetical protein